MKKGTAMKDNPILNDESVRRKRAAINMFMPILNAVCGDDRPLVVEVTAHRMGDEPVPFGTVTLAPGAGAVVGEIHANELEICFVGMVLSLYGDVLTRTGIQLAESSDGADNYMVCERDAATPTDL
ncbi:hypothetical protein JS533_005140 [Bifidobacterium amazonense]|uniref:Uncharacterized protein n=1 Tax=Bifidobacterium amazonense TaxID=2809027 RepID=A0ABS9VU83_9BIFI|nr:hypothetical protein [Bifidobacterium amazonense]MCH9275658.1 hypothetical protein [Bifidobacterium amazonense]